MGRRDIMLMADVDEPATSGTSTPALAVPKPVVANKWAGEDEEEGSVSDGCGVTQWQDGKDGRDGRLGLF